MNYIVYYQHYYYLSLEAEEKLDIISKGDIPIEDDIRGSGRDV